MSAETSIKHIGTSGNRVNLVQDFIRLEAEYDLFNRDVNGLYYWHLIRKWVFDEICKGVRGFEFGGHPDFRAQFTLKSILPKVPTLALNVAKSFRGLQASDTCYTGVGFLGNWKTSLSDSGVVSPFLDKLIPNLHEETFVFERPHNLSHIKNPRIPNVCYTDYLEFCWAASLLMRRYERDAEATWFDMEPFASKFDSHFDVQIDRESLRKRIRYVVTGERVLGRGLERFFRTSRPRCIVEIEHYSVFCLIANLVLNKLEVPVIELQHGQIGPGHVAYNGIASGYERRLPKAIATFGDFWGDSCTVSEKANRFVSTGSILLECNQLENDSENTKRKKCLLVVCQGNDGGSIDSFVANLIKDPRSKQWRIIIKMHPSEARSWRKVHPAIAAIHSHVEVATEGTIGKYLSMSEAVVGISSTVLFEAIAYKVKVFVLNAIDSEIAKPLVDIGAAVAISNPSDFFESCEGHHWLDRSTEEYVWKNGAVGNICALIESS